MYHGMMYHIHTYTWKKSVTMNRFHVTCLFIVYRLACVVRCLPYIEKSVLNIDGCACVRLSCMQVCWHVGMNAWRRQFNRSNKCIRTQTRIGEGFFHRNENVRKRVVCKRLEVHVAANKSFPHPSPGKNTGDGA